MCFILQECITGVVVFNSPTDIKHDGITLTLEGTVNLQLSPKNVGIFEAFYNSVKVRNLMLYYFCIRIRGSHDIRVQIWRLILAPLAVKNGPKHLCNNYGMTVVGCFAMKKLISNSNLTLSIDFARINKVLSVNE